MPSHFSFTSAVSALRTQTRSFQAISDNIANSRTDGFKRSEVRFEEVLASHKINGHRDQRQFDGVGGYRRLFAEKEGSVENTSRNLDAAIRGEGFFVTQTSHDGGGRFEFSDAGQFDRKTLRLDDGSRTFLTDVKGNYLMGWAYDPETGGFQTDGGLNNLTSIETTGGLPSDNPNAVIYPAAATTVAQLVGNIDSETPAARTIVRGRGPETDADGAPVRRNEAGEIVGPGEDGTVRMIENRATLPAKEAMLEARVFDGSAGEGGTGVRTVRLLFSKLRAEGDVHEDIGTQWRLRYASPGGTVTGLPEENIVSFDEKGDFLTLNGGEGATQDVTVAWGEGDAETETSIAFDLSRITQRFGTTTVFNTDINGNRQGELVNVAFGRGGLVNGNFDNGLTRPLAKLPLAEMVNPDGLTPRDGTHFTRSADSGDIVLYEMDKTDRADFVPGALEKSNVELHEEFSNMVITQRAYGSASQLLRTADEMVKTVTRL